MITFSQLGNQGRIANQIFELSCCISYAIDNDHQYKFPTWEYEQYFNLHNCYSDQIKPTIIYHEPNFHYTKIPSFPRDEIIDFRGYMQSYKYFDNNQDIIMGLFTPKQGHNIQYNTTAIHVRRGDYLNLTKEYIQLNMEYYYKAMQMINSKKYLVFSDDIEWCKQNFHGNNIMFSENKKPIEDLSLFLACEHAIIANSSFSWWGAYLNKNPSKIIIAPEKWFGPALPHDTKDLLPEKWIKII